MFIEETLPNHTPGYFYSLEEGCLFTGAKRQFHLCYTNLWFRLHNRVGSSQLFVLFLSFFSQMQ